MPRLTILKPRVRSLDTKRVKPATVSTLQRLRGPAWERLRVAVLRRSNGLCECARCRSSGALTIAHEVDHIVPLWEGGTDDLSNLQAIGRECHKRKTADEAARREGRGGSKVWGLET